MKVYIAGKVSGLPIAQVFIKFSSAEFRLKQQGYEVVNPIKLCSQSWKWKHCMQVCLKELIYCDAICALDDWAESKGARVEVYVAEMLGLKIITL